LSNDQKLPAALIDEEATQSDALSQVERQVTFLVRRTQKVHLHGRNPDGGRPLDRSGYAILGLIYDGGPQRPGELASDFGLDASTISRQVAHLERTELATREPDPEERRACHMTLTAAGRESLVATRARRREAVRGILGSWPSKDQEDLARLLGKFNRDMAELEDATPAPSESTTAGTTTPRPPHRGVRIQ
jgi:DNA-binding MarR family transcriptional regulator